MIIFDQIISVIAIGFAGLSLLISCFALWISWKNFKKYTKKQLQNIIEQELKNSTEETNYQLIKKENWNFFIDNKFDKDDFYQKHYQVFQKWQRWNKIKKLEPIVMLNNPDLSHLATKMKFRNIKWIPIRSTTESYNYERNPNTIIFKAFYYALMRFLKNYFNIIFTEQDYHKGKLHDFSKILFSKKICKKLKQLINHQYK